MLPGGYVAITDNADPMDVVVYRTAVHAQKRQVCAVPVFGHGAGSTENSLIGAGRSLVVENNYGYTGAPGGAAGQTTTPGFARVDIGRHGRGCQLVWSNTTVSAPRSCPSSRWPPGWSTPTPSRPATRATRGTGPRSTSGPARWCGRSWPGPASAYNNNYAGIALGPDGTAYLGVIPGLVAMRDGG